ncbi:MAG: hypothetical protein ABJO88_03650 [Parasphingorhabdus sp.]
MTAHIISGRSAIGPIAECPAQAALDAKEDITRCSNSECPSALATPQTGRLLLANKTKTILL